MTIEIVYRVKKSNGELAGEYMDKKEADAHDRKLDCIYTIVDLMVEGSSDLDLDLMEVIAEKLVERKQELINALKKVKDFPAKHEARDLHNITPDSNVETLTPVKKVVGA